MALFVIPAKAGIHFDFSAGGAATTLLSGGIRMRNPENSPFVFVFDSDPPCPGVKTAERGGEKAKAKMDSGFRRNDGCGQFPARRGNSSTPLLRAYIKITLFPMCSILAKRPHPKMGYPNGRKPTNR